MIKISDECNKILDSIASSMSEAFRVCDLEMAPYYETATEFCDFDGGTGVAGTGGTADGAATDPSSKPYYKCTQHIQVYLIFSRKYLSNLYEYIKFSF